MSGGYAPGRAAAAVMAKEWAQIVRDPSTIGLVLVLPLLLMFLFGSAVSLDTRATRTALVDHDSGRGAGPIAIPGWHRKAGSG